MQPGVAKGLSPNPSFANLDAKVKKRRCCRNWLQAEETGIGTQVSHKLPVTPQVLEIGDELPFLLRTCPLKVLVWLDCRLHVRPFSHSFRKAQMSTYCRHRWRGFLSKGNSWRWQAWTQSLFLPRLYHPPLVIVNGCSGHPDYRIPTS